MPLEAIALAVGAKPNTPSFISAWQELGRSGYVRWAGDVRQGRGHPVPSFEATPAGREVADLIESGTYS